MHYTPAFYQVSISSVLGFSYRTREFFKLPLPKGYESYADSAALGLSSGKLFISGGRCGQASEARVPYTFLVEPLNSSCRRLADMNQARASHQLAYYSSFVFAVGGTFTKENKIVLTNTCEKYDPERNQWVALPPMSVCRSNFTLV